MTFSYNLIIFHTPGRQDVSDFMTVRNMMMGRAPEIQVHIVSAGVPSASDFWETAAERPTLLFSPMPLHIVGHIRGHRLVQRELGKLKELEQLARAGFPIPETRLITPELTLDETTWGPFTIVKPNRGYRGEGISLMRTEEVRWIDTSRLPADDPRHGRKLLAQRFIDTGPYPSCYRVMSVLGRPLYCRISIATEARLTIDTSATPAVTLMTRRLELVNEPDVINLARDVHSALPQIPVMGLDIVREHASGKLFVLEFNSGGRTWHLSSDYGQKHRRQSRLDLYGQFNALATITDALIEATRKYAV